MLVLMWVGIVIGGLAAFVSVVDLIVCLFDPSPDELVWRDFIIPFVRRTFSRWEERPKWTVEYFGEYKEYRVLTDREFQARHGISRERAKREPGLWEDELANDKLYVGKCWGFVEWEKNSFSSEEKALKAFQRAHRNEPHLKFRSKCLFPGVSKNAAKQKTIEAASAQRTAYNEKYTEFLEDELRKMSK